MQVRNVTIGDLDQLASLFDGYRVWYGKDSDVEGGKTFIKERIERRESVIFVVEDGDNVLLGFTQLYPIFSSVRMRRMWLLNDLFVHPDHRGRGVSKMLIAAAQQLCRETDACELMLETEVTNTIGNKLYPSTGFKLNDHNFYYWTVE